MSASGSNPLCAPLWRARATAIIAVLLASVSSGLAQADSASSPRRRGGEEDQAGRRAMSPQDIQARMLAGLRERFGVTSDEEWGVISERLLKLTEIRRTIGGGPGGAPPGRGGPPGGGAQGPGGFRSRPGGGSPEIASLQSAVTDKLPEAEIKARLALVRQTRKANEAKLQAAQEELRAVLTVRQEALAVLMGLMP